MPVIAFVSPKGGAGKTTSSLILATQIAELGQRVAFIDADPNHPVKTWAQDGGAPETMTVISDVTEDDIDDRIDEARQHSNFVIVDLEGTAATIVAHAISAADFVVVPTQGSQLDAEQAGRAFKLIRAQERVAQRHNPGFKLRFGVLFTRTAVAIQSRDTTYIRKTFADAGIPVFNTELKERAAFKAMFSYRRTLSKLTKAEVSNLDKALDNANTFAAEVLEVLKKGFQEVTQETTQEAAQ
ncbi:ParA family protein [Cupriavidus malaysiensis]|uniref:Chromosome partitioning protein ParA n=1 Tax=Cupriavidus malaysiensis TaxID=367825 RepID=A0ABM6FGP6_9BURK|nr:ParA family protein [Cupriavidus malaysiensis]AOZ11132.1 chromosome partitioning protein ParA [Cupriavidus malaysiensis]